jgi:hypothetical protein
MRRMSNVLLALTLVCASVDAVEAQQRRPARRVSRTPAEGSRAWGANFGVAAPTDGLLNNGLTPNVNFEYYVTPRWSIRGLGGAAWTDYSAPRFGTNVRPSFVDVNGVYNWEGGAVHPFVTAGLGVYHYHVSQPPFSGGNTEPGVNAGGGVEFFLNPRDALKGEILYHGVAGQASGPFATVETSFWSATVGFKRYF